VETIELPELDIFLAEKADLSFGEIYKEKAGDSILWRAHATVHTNWEAIDPALNFTFVYTIDAKTGDILAMETLSGA